MGFYSEIPYEEFGYYDTPSTHEVGGSILTGILMFYLIILLVGLTVAVVNYISAESECTTWQKRRNGLSMAGVCTICQNVPSGRAWRNGTSENKQIKNPGIWLIVLPFISSIVTGILYVVIWVVLGFGVVFSSYGGFSFGAVTGIIIVTVIVIVFLQCTMQSTVCFEFL